MEEWKEIPGTGGYQASTRGRVKSPPHVRPNALTGGVSEHSGRVLKGSVNKTTGYRIYYVGGAVKKRLLGHRLVALAFHGEPPEGCPLVRHLDGNPDNNKPENLAWGTYSENEADKKTHGRNFYLNVTHCPQGHPYSEENTYRTREDHRVCLECRRERSRAQKRPGTLPDGDHRHGTENGYLTYGCRCDPCREASSRYSQTRRALKDPLSYKKKSNKSGFQGVIEARPGRWIGRVHRSGKTYRTATYNTPEEAHEAVTELRGTLPDPKRSGPRGLTKPPA